MNVEIEKYYNSFKSKLIKDFLEPNRRIENAIKICLEKIPENASNILDLGFGIGWSTFEFARNYPNASVQGYDISPELTKVAKSIFRRPNLDYNCLDLTVDFPSGQFDVIVLIDVFEHIPKAGRISFYERIKNVLSDSGIILFTCPSIYHQEYLRTHKPDGLQPIDEDITLEIFMEMATFIGGEVSEFRFMNIWNESDYLFAEISWGNYRNRGGFKVVNNSLLNLWQRRHFVEESSECFEFLPPLPLKFRLKYQLYRYFRL